MKILNIMKIYRNNIVLSILVIFLISSCQDSKKNTDVNVTREISSDNNLNRDSVEDTHHERKVLKTGQYIRYIDFDDGYYKKGIEHKYVRNDKKEVVIDNLTNLMWQDDKAIRDLTISWFVARKYCVDLTLASYTDWRLPSRAELEGIVDYGKYNPSISNIFKNIDTYNNLTSTELASDSSRVWIVSFIRGQEEHVFKDSWGSVRCVRDNK